jgi:hypothetical protein|tara:strand:- start:30 stop:158 length:129 start_codon:yes stop_codon:yes gene_type:complete
MKSVASFYTLAEALAFAEAYRHNNIIVDKDAFGGRFHVYDLS